MHPFCTPRKHYTTGSWCFQGIQQGVLGQFPLKKIALNPKTNPNSTLTLTGEQFSSRTIVWLPLNPKTNHSLDPDPNPNRGAIFFGGNCPDTEQGCIGNKEGKTWVWKNLSYSEIRLQDWISTNEIILKIIKNNQKAVLILSRTLQKYWEHDTTTIPSVYAQTIISEEHNLI